MQSECILAKSVPWDNGFDLDKPMKQSINAWSQISLTVSLFKHKQQTTMSASPAKLQMSLWLPFTSTRSSLMPFLSRSAENVANIVCQENVKKNFLILNDNTLPFDWRGACEFKHQLLLVAIIFTPKGLKRLAKSTPIFPNPAINTYNGHDIFQWYLQCKE